MICPHCNITASFKLGSIYCENSYYLCDRPDHEFFFISPIEFSLRVDNVKVLRATDYYYLFIFIYDSDLKLKQLTSTLDNFDYEELNNVVLKYKKLLPFL